MELGTSPTLPVRLLQNRFTSPVVSRSRDVQTAFVFRCSMAKGKAFGKLYRADSSTSKAPDPQNHNCPENVWERGCKSSVKPINHKLQLDICPKVSKLCGSVLSMRSTQYRGTIFLRCYDAGGSLIKNVLLAETSTMARESFDIEFEKKGLITQGCDPRFVEHEADLLELGKEAPDPSPKVHHQVACF